MKTGDSRFMDDRVPCYSHPACRATIVDGTVTLNGWRPNLMDGGPTQAALDRIEQRGVVLADLTRLGDEGDELLASFVTRGPALEDAREALVAWARTVGYRRLWLDDRVVALDGGPAVAGTAVVECPTCRATWSDTRPGFWFGVRENGWFPGFCLACGGSLPEWWVREPAGADGPAETGERAREGLASLTHRGAEDV